MLKEAVDRSKIELAALSSPQNRGFLTVSTVSNVSTGTAGATGIAGATGATGATGTTDTPVSTVSTVSTGTPNATARKRFEQSLRQKGRDLVTTSRAVTKSICQVCDSLKEQQEIVFYVCVPSNS